MLIKEIPNAELTEKDLPPPNASLAEIAKFALTFNGLEYWGPGEQGVTRADHWVALFEKDGSLPDSLNDLRACLFFEETRDYWSGFCQDEQERCFCRALVEAIRGKVSG